MTLSIAQHAALQTHPFTKWENQVSSISDVSEYYIGKIVFVGDRISSLPLDIKKALYDQIIENNPIEADSILTVNLENIYASSSMEKWNYMVNITYYTIEKVDSNKIVRFGPEDKWTTLVQKYKNKNSVFLLPYGGHGMQKKKIRQKIAAIFGK